MRTLVLLGLLTAIPVWSRLQVRDNDADEDETDESISNKGHFTESQLWAADNFTAMGSTLINEEKLPVIGIGIGFMGCDPEKLSDVIAQHPGAIVVDGVQKNYFSSKRHGECNKLAERGGRTPYEKYIKGCFKAHFPGENEAVIDFSPGYAVAAWDGAVLGMKRLEAEARLRFFAVVCEPKERALRSLWGEKIAEKDFLGKASFPGLSDWTAHALRKHLNGAFSHTIGTGEYYRMLSQWALHFPLETLLIVNSDHLDKVETHRRIFQHLGLKAPSDWRTQKYIDNAPSRINKETTPGVEDISRTTKKRMFDHFHTFDNLLWMMLETKWW